MTKAKELDPRAALQRVEADLRATFFGMDETAHILVAALATPGATILLEGEHGAGKTSVATRIARYFGREPFYRQVKPDHTIHDVFYTYDVAALTRGERKVIPLALDAEFPVFDEFLKHPTLGAAVHDFIEERRVDGMPARWVAVFGLTNPTNEFYATNIALQDFATKDRWAVSCFVQSVPPYDLFEMGKRVERQYKPALPDFTVPLEILDRARAEVARVRILPSAHMVLQLFLSELYVCRQETDQPRQEGAQEVNKWMLLGRSMEALCAVCRHRNEICAKASATPARAQRATVWLAKALAWLEGSEKVTQEHVRRALRHTIPHRTHYAAGHLGQFPTGMAAFAAVEAQFTKNQQEREKRGLFAHLPTLLRRLAEGKWDAGAYRKLVDVFRDDLPVAYFLDGFRAARYEPLVAKVIDRVDATADPEALAAMRETIGDLGLEDTDAANVRRLIDARIGSETVEVKFLRSQSTKVMHALIAAVSELAPDVGSLEEFEKAITTGPRADLGPYVSVLINPPMAIVTLRGPAVRVAEKVRAIGVRG